MSPTDDEPSDVSTTSPTHTSVRLPHRRSSLLASTHAAPLTVEELERNEQNAREKRWADNLRSEIVASSQKLIHTKRSLAELHATEAMNRSRVSQLDGEVEYAQLQYRLPASLLSQYVASLSAASLSDFHFSVDLYQLGGPFSALPREVRDLVRERKALLDGSFSLSLRLSLSLFVSLSSSLSLSFRLSLRLSPLSLRLSLFVSLLSLRLSLSLSLCLSLFVCIVASLVGVRVLWMVHAFSSAVFACCVVCVVLCLLLCWCACLCVCSFLLCVCVYVCVFVCVCVYVCVHVCVFVCHHYLWFCLRCLHCISPQVLVFLFYWFVTVWTAYLMNVCLCNLFVRMYVRMFVCACI